MKVASNSNACSIAGDANHRIHEPHDESYPGMEPGRNIEASVQPSRDRKQKITDQIAQLKYKEPNSPKIVVLEQELVRAEAESLVAEAQLSNITREKLKAAFTYQFDALREHSEKLAIIAGFGKHLLELVDDTPVTPGETRTRVCLLAEHVHHRPHLDARARDPGLV